MKANETLFPAECPHCGVTYESSDDGGVELKPHPLFKYIDSRKRYVCDDCDGGMLFTSYYPLHPK